LRTTTRSSLSAAKVIAGREKDLAFLRAAVEHQMADAETLFRRLSTVEVDPEVLKNAAAAIGRAFRGTAD
jgi:hypothetical protein